MAVDATGTPSSPDNIPTYNTGADAPSGKGLNNIVASIQGLFTALRAGTMPGGKISAAGITPGTNGQFFQTSGGVAVWGAPPVTNTIWTPVSNTVTVSNTITTTQLFSQAITGGTLGSTKRLRVTAFGDILNNSGAGVTPALQIDWAGSTLWKSTSLNLAFQATRRPWYIEFSLVANADTGHQVLNGYLKVVSGGSSPTTGLGDTNWGSSQGFSLLATNGPVAADSTVSQTLSMSVTHSTANASVDMRCHYAQIEVVG